MVRPGYENVIPETGMVELSAEEQVGSQQQIRVDELDHFDEDWVRPFPLREGVRIRKGEKFSEYYTLFEELGEGKFGKVYRCVEKATGLMLAAKCIKIRKDTDFEKVEKEVNILAQMRHKCIAQIYDAFATESNDVLLVMEIVEGGELFDRVADDSYILTECAVALIMFQICEAIRYIHSQNIIHLDLKPENIMCVSQCSNQIKLIDFGLAQWYDGSKDLMFMAGTPEFAAPEVIKYEPLDFHTDMWSLGVIAYILLSGQSPFLGETLAHTYCNVERGNWMFCEEFTENGISSEAKDFISRLLIVQKEKRMLPDQCLNHRWIMHNREKALMASRAASPAVSQPIPVAKLRSYVKNKRFRRLVFGVLFVNSIMRMMQTLQKNKSTHGIEYVRNMLEAADSQGKEADSNLLLKAFTKKRTTADKEEAEPQQLEQSVAKVEAKREEKPEKMELEMEGSKLATEKETTKAGESAAGEKRKVVKKVRTTGEKKKRSKSEARRAAEQQRTRSSTEQTSSKKQKQEEKTTERERKQEERQRLGEKLKTAMEQGKREGEGGKAKGGQVLRMARLVEQVDRQQPMVEHTPAVAGTSSGVSNGRATNSLVSSMLRRLEQQNGQGGLTGQSPLAFAVTAVPPAKVEEAAKKKETRLKEREREKAEIEAKGGDQKQKERKKVVKVIKRKVRRRTAEESGTVGAERDEGRAVARETRTVKDSVPEEGRRTKEEDRNGQQLTLGERRMRWESGPKGNIVSTLQSGWAKPKLRKVPSSQSLETQRRDTEEAGWALVGQDVFDFSLLRMKLQNRIMGLKDREDLATEEENKQRFELQKQKKELQTNLNIKRAMRKWLTMDKETRQQQGCRHRGAGALLKQPEEVPEWAR